jgi:hypothetical protein
MVDTILNVDLVTLILTGEVGMFTAEETEAQRGQAT